MMKYLFFSIQLIYKIYYLILFSGLLLVTFPVYYFLLSQPGRYKYAFPMMRYHAFLILVLTGVFMKVKGKNNIPSTGAFVLCSNHSSFVDTWCIYSLFKRYFVFTGKKEIEKWPLFHIFYTSGMNIMVDRSSLASSFRALRRMAFELKKGIPLVIFPEGTRSKEAPTLAPFKPGAFAVAIQSQVPILPVTFVSNWKLLGGGNFLTSSAMPGISEVVIHAPISTLGLTKTDVDELSQKVRMIIQFPIDTHCVALPQTLSRVQ